MGGVIIAVLIGVGVYFSISSEKDEIEKKINLYTDPAMGELEFGASTSGEDSESALEKPSFFTELLNNMMERSESNDKIADMLARADMKFKPGEYVALVGISIIAMAGFGFVFGGGASISGIGTLTPKVFAIIGGVLGSRFPKIFVMRQQKKRLNNFSQQLPEMLTLMVNGLRAGFSTMQALEAVSKELPPPISMEFRRVVQEMQLGISMEVALENLLTRIPSEDLDLVITAINVQREVGGNLAEVLDSITHTIRERIRIKGEIKTLVTQVVFSGRFLSVLPVILSFILYAVNRDYMMQFFIEPKWCGFSILGCSAILIMVGYFVMNKIADIEI
jgi:tight adherence protein B